jgi:hypothetical protein
MLRLVLALCFVFLASGEIVDQIAIVIGPRVITEQQIDEEIRVTALLNHQPIVRDLKARKAAADRLLQQYLVQQRIDLTRYPKPTPEDVDRYLDQVRSTFGSPAEFAHALTEYRLDDSIVRDHLALQLTTLRFIEYRFRPETNVSETEIQDYYRRQIENWDAAHPGAQPPSLESSREAIRQALIAQHTDETLNSWLADARRAVNVTYLDRSLQPQP